MLGKFVSYRTKNNAYFSTLRSGDSAISIKNKGEDQALDMNQSSTSFFQPDLGCSLKSFDGQMREVIRQPTQINSSERLSLFKSQKSTENLEQEDFYMSRTFNTSTDFFRTETVKNFADELMIRGENKLDLEFRHAENIPSNERILVI